MYKHVYLALDLINDTWDELVAKEKKSNSSDENAYDKVYDKMIDKFSCRILEDFEVDSATQELKKRSNRVKSSPPRATADESEIIIEQGEVSQYRRLTKGNVNVIIFTSFIAIT